MRRSSVPSISNKNSIGALLSPLHLPCDTAYATRSVSANLSILREPPSASTASVLALVPPSPAACRLHGNGGAGIIRSWECVRYYPTPYLAGCGAERRDRHAA